MILISFIEDYSCYAYPYIIYEKSEFLDMFKIFRTEIETQLSKKIKCVRSNVVVSTTTDMTVQKNNIQDHLMAS